MAKGLGARVDRRFGLGSLSRGEGVKAKGVYPQQGKGLGEYGTIKFPTILEAYDYRSDFNRWKLGQEYHYGTGRGWADLKIRSIARFNPGAVSGRSLDIVTTFPSHNSPEKTWYVGLRTRGSIILPQPLSSSAITLNTSDPDPANHTLVYDVSAVLTPTQVGIFQIFVGDQFEDTASGPNYPDDLVPNDVGSVALTLISASVGAMTLTFDLSRAYGRVERNGNVRWKKYIYDPSSPRSWNTSSGRHLCSAHKLFCCCPDHLGGQVANLEYVEGEANIGTFPLPTAMRTVTAPWEKQGVGYYRQWRTLPIRIDERRECKHIHAMRWDCGIPWEEPLDYPTESDNSSLSFRSAFEEEEDTDLVFEYFRKRQGTYDRYLLSLAEVVGINLFPGGDPRENIRSDPRPIFWNDGTEPLAIWCRQNDWWLKRGSQRLRIFNATTNQFESTVTVGGVPFPMVEVVGEKDPGAPVIVK